MSTFKIPHYIANSRTSLLFALLAGCNGLVPAEPTASQSVASIDGLLTSQAKRPTELTRPEKVPPPLGGGSLTISRDNQVAVSGNRARSHRRDQRRKVRHRSARPGRSPAVSSQRYSACRADGVSRAPGHNDDAVQVGGRAAVRNLRIGRPGKAAAEGFKAAVSNAPAGR